MIFEYNGVNITDRVDLLQADFDDVAGGSLDRVTVTAADPQKLWSQWKPKKDDTLRIARDGIDSGIHYIDDIELSRGRITLRALPVKQSAKTPENRAWENITLLQLAGETAKRLGLALTVHGAPNPSYQRLDQIQSSDLAFLTERCALESTAVKVHGGQLILIGEPAMEQSGLAVLVNLGDVDGDPSYRDKTTGLKGGCRISYQGIIGEAAAPISGPWLIVEHLPVFSAGEALRFSKGLLRQENKLGCTAGIVLRKIGGITAGTRAELKGFGLPDGAWFTHRAVHQMVQQHTALTLRRPLEGY